MTATSSPAPTSRYAAREAAELRAHALTALRRGDVNTARELVRQSDLLDPPDPKDPRP